MFWSIWLRAVGRWNEFESGGHRSYAKRRTISRFGERFRDGQYSLVSFLFAVFLLTVPCARHLYKLGARAPVPYRVGATGFESDGRVGFGLRSARSHWIQLLYSYFRAKPETQLRYAKHRLHYRRSGRRCWLVPTSQTEVWLLSPRTSQVRRALASSCSDRSVQEINMLSKTVITFFLHTTFIHQELAVSENE